jgi:hypothetical protein
MNFQFLGLPQISTRLTTLEPTTIDAKTFECALVRGTPIARTFGVERLRIIASSINLDRMRDGCMVPVLDSLREDSAVTRSLAKLVDVRIEDGAVWGRVRFHETKNGKKAAELVAAGAVDITLAYNIEEFEVFDANNQLIDPNDSERSNEAGIVFEVTRWQIAALGLVRADRAANNDHHFHRDRAYAPISPAIAEIFARMAERHLAANADDGVRVSGKRVRPQLDISIFDKVDRGDKIVAATRARMRAAQKLMECGGNVDWKSVRLPPDLIFYGSPEALK